MGGSMKAIPMAVLLVTLSVSSAAYAKDFSVNVKATTLGVGVEGEYSLNGYFGARVGVNYFTYSYDGTEDQIDYDFDLETKSVSALLDYHPFKGSFKLSAGVLYNGNELDGKATTAATYNIGNTTYLGSQVGLLTGSVEYNKFAPYAGIGWDTSFGKESGWGFIFEVGALFQGSPDVTLQADGPIASDPGFQTDLALEKSNFEDDLNNFEIYPVVAIGLSYRF
jgi:hypothetical protein